MVPDADELSVLSTLLDEALALDDAQLEPWLASLPDPYRRHAPRLREMLSRRASLDDEAAAWSLPNLAEIDDAAVRGARVGAYRLLREIGRGGMGSVWLAERADGSFERQVALKLPRGTWADGLVERFHRERRIGALLEHPHICRLYDAGVDDRGRPFLAMAWIEGEALDAHCDARRLGVRARLALFLQVLDAVAHAHARHVIHRDLKPANILVDGAGQAHLLDFGIATLVEEAAPAASLTAQQGRVLTPAYASPEQIAGGPTGTASDIYSCGVVLYELLAGRSPYACEPTDRAAIERAVLAGDPPPASLRAADDARRVALRGDLDAILAQALRREPSQRYASAEAFAQDIARHLAGQSIAARPERAVGRLLRRARRHRLVLGIAAAAFGVVAVAAGTALLQAGRASAQESRARLATAFIAEMLHPTARVAGDGATTPQAFVDRGASLVEERFAREPDIEVDLLGAIGQAYEAMGADGLAADYARRQVALLDTLPEDRSRRIGALLLLADSRLHEQRHDEAGAAVQAAVSLASPGEPLRLQALALAATVALEAGHVDDARAAAAAAHRELPARPPASTGLARLLALDVRLLVHDNRFPESVPAFEQAVRTALEAEGPLSRTAIDIRLDRADVMGSLGRTEDAKAVLAQALAALRARGGPDEVRAAVEAARMWSLFCDSLQVPRQEALDVVRRSQAFVAGQPQALPPIVRGRIAAYLGAVYLDWNDLDQAQHWIGESERWLGRTGGGLALQRKSALDRARLAEYIGDDRGAEAEWRTSLALRREMGYAEVPQAVWDWAHVGLMLARQGRPDEGERFLDGAPAFAARVGDPRMGTQFRHVLPWARARIRLERGDLAGARAVLPDFAALAAPARVDPDVEDLYGEVWCATDRGRQGLALLDDSLRQSAARGDSAADPDAARIHASAGLCAAALGDPATARAHAQQARRAFELQPRIGPYYRAPLERLERLLAATAKRGR